MDWHNAPSWHLLGVDPLNGSQTIATCAWLLEPCIRPLSNSFIPSSMLRIAVHTSLKAHAKESYWGYLQELNTILADRPWIMGNEFTLADPYAWSSLRGDARCACRS
jgi:glutathione S-transferase